MGQRELDDSRREKTQQECCCFGSRLHYPQRFSRILQGGRFERTKGTRLTKKRCFRTFPSGSLQVLIELFPSHCLSPAGVTIVLSSSVTHLKIVVVNRLSLPGCRHAVEDNAVML